MKTHLFSFALGLMMLMAACQKDEVSLLDENDKLFAPLPSERCGCLPPVEFETKDVTNVSAKLLWNAMPEAMTYRIEINEVFDDIVYVFETAEGNQITLTNLAPNTRYIYRVATICGNDESVVSENQYFGTKSKVHGDPGYNLPKLYKEGHLVAQ